MTNFQEVIIHLPENHSDVVLENQADPLVFESQEINIDQNKTLQSDSQSELIIGNHNEAIATVHEKKKAFPCADCTKSYGHANSLKSHIDLAHNNKTYPCSHCGKVLTSSRNLTAHVASVHENVKNFSCEFCTKAFTRKSDLKVHVTRKHK
jgi:uncharacterized C2H2 Zn-finger protein